MVKTRPAVREDLDIIVQMQLAMALETEDMRLDKGTLRAGVRAVFDDPRKGRYFVAEIDGKVAGLLLTMDEWSDWRNGTVLWIHSVYVSPEFRRGGVFRSLYQSLKRQVEADPALKGLRLYVHKANHAAIKTYTSLGMDGEHYALFEWMK